MKRRMYRENDELELKDSEVTLDPEAEAEFAERVEDLADELDVPFALITNNTCTTSDEITPSIDDAITVLADELEWESDEDDAPEVLDVPNTNDEAGIYQSSEVGDLYTAVSSLDDDEVAVAESLRRRAARKAVESRRTARKARMRRAVESKRSSVHKPAYMKVESRKRVTRKIK